MLHVFLILLHCHMNIHVSNCPWRCVDLTKKLELNLSKRNYCIINIDISIFITMFSCSSGISSDSSISSSSRKNSIYKIFFTTDGHGKAPELCDQNTVWVTKWVDYSNKYGFGFRLSSDAVGVLFNDTSRMLLQPDGR